MIYELFLYLSLLHIPNLLWVTTDEHHDQYSLIGFCHVCHQSVSEYAFPDVFRHIITKPHPSGLSVNVNLLFLDFSDHDGAYLCCIKRLFDLLLNCLILIPGFNSRKSNQRYPLPSRELLLTSFWISCNTAGHFHGCIWYLHKKHFGLRHWHWCRWSHRWYRILWSAFNCCAYGHLPIVRSSRSFCQAFSFWYGRVTAIMYVSEALVSSFIPFV